MSTGDLKNNLRKLQTEVKLMRYPETLDIKQLTVGDPKAFMPILHFAFTSYNTSLAESIAAKDIVLFAKSDAGFMDSVYKILRDMFSYKPLVTKDQFFSSQFAERKIIMCTQILQYIQRHCRSQPSSKTSFKPNLSMDNLSKPPIGRIKPKSAVTEKKENKDSRNSSLTRPTSSTTATRSGLGVTRSASTRSATKPHVVKEVLDPNMSCDSALSSSVPSIARVKPQSVEVVTMETIQGASGANGPASASLRMGFAEPVSSPRASDKDILISELTKQLEQKSQCLESFERRLRNMETRLELQSSAPPPPTLPHPSLTTEDLRRLNDLDARMKLLENRVLIMESKISAGIHAMDGDKLKVQSPNSNSPVTPGKTGTFVTVTSVVNGESKVRKMAREAEAKIRSHSAEDDLDRLSPVVKHQTVETALNKSEEELFTMIPDPEPVNSSTPAKAHAHEDSMNLKCVDVSTQDQAHRIQQLMQSTQSMLGPPQTKIPADEVARQDVD